MGLVDRFADHVKSLFGRSQERTPHPLSNSVVQHDMIDEGVLGEFRDQSSRFNSVFDAVPEVEVEPAELDENGVEVKAAREELYEPAPDLYSDLFYAHHTYSEPEIKHSEDVLPSHDLHRQIMQQYVHADGFDKLRAMTRHDDVSSALATLDSIDTINEHLSSTLKEHAARAKQMQDAQDAMIDGEGGMAGIQQAVRDQGGQATQEQKDALKQAAQAKYDARKRLEQLAQQQKDQPVGMDVQQAVNDAIDNAQKTAEGYNSLPGTQQGAAINMSPEQALKYAEEIKRNPQVRRVLDMLGRMERDMRYKRTNRVIGGREEPIDVMLGADLGLTLPAELMKLRHPLLRLDFMRRFNERSVLMYETVGFAEAGKGPIVVVVDVSSSMGGGKIEWARAASLSLVSIAHREKRHAACIDFNTVVTGTWEFPARTPIDTGRVLEVAGRGASGGTDITNGLRKAREIIDTQPNFKKADIVLVSDGEDRYGEDDAELKGYFGQKGVRVHGIGIMLARSNYLDEMCESWMPVEDLANASDATSHLATAIT